MYWIDIAISLTIIVSFFAIISSSLRCAFSLSLHVSVLLDGDKTRAELYYCYFLSRFDSLGNDKRVRIPKWREGSWLPKVSVNLVFIIFFQTKKMRHSDSDNCFEMIICWSFYSFYSFFSSLWNNSLFPSLMIPCSHCAFCRQVGKRKSKKATKNDFTFVWILQR